MTGTDKSRRIIQRFHEIDAYLTFLVDKDPKAAIKEARKLRPDNILDTYNTDALRAAIMIDAGAACNDKSAVDDGVAILRRLLEQHPERLDLKYCLANGLSAQASCITYSGPEWYLETDDLRREARRLFHQVITGCSSPEIYAQALTYLGHERLRDIATRALTNLGNELLRAHRYVEAYDYYARALEYDPTNGVALTGAARVLLHLVERGIGDGKILLRVAARHLKTAQANAERIRQLAGEYGYKMVADLLNTDLGDTEMPDLSTADDYQRFVAKHRLALAPTIEGLDLSMPRWDSLRIGEIFERISDAAAGNPPLFGIPPLFAMFNVLKGDYLAARYLAYLALNGDVPESGSYADTLDYATYGMRSSLLTLSQRACFDLLDKVAVAASEYLRLPGSPKGITFLNRWFDDQDTKRWHPQVLYEIRSGNTALIAITEVARDVAGGGFLQEKRAMRHSSTHRFTVLHDLFGEPRRKSRYIEHYSSDDFIAHLIETIQLTRAVLFYFVEMIRHREQRIGRDAKYRVHLFVPDHSWVRGEDDTKDWSPETAE